MGCFCDFFFLVWFFVYLLGFILSFFKDGVAKEGETTLGLAAFNCWNKTLSLHKCHFIFCCNIFWFHCVVQVGWAWRLNRLFNMLVFFCHPGRLRPQQNQSSPFQHEPHEFGQAAAQGGAAAAAGGVWKAEGTREGARRRRLHLGESGRSRRFSVPTRSCR